MKRNDFIFLALVLFLIYVISLPEIPERWEKVKSLQPSVRKKFIRFLKEAEAITGYKVVVTSSHRTSAQQAYYKKQDPRNASPGSSTHELDTGIDLELITPTGIRIKKSTPKNIWIATGVPALAKQYGFRWGGDFKNYFDPVHYDKLVA